MLRARVLACGILMGSIAAPAAAFAQEKGDAGITMGYPASIGFVYHVTDRFAIRPEVTLAVSSSKSESQVSTSEGDTFAVGVGISGIFYLRQWDKLRTYICPRYAYSHGESTTSSTLLLPFVEDDNESTQTSNSHQFIGMFGAQLALHDRFSVFGEVGAGYAHQRSESDLSGLRSTANQFSTRTAVGVILYF
jgi:hypothetical protein